MLVGSRRVSRSRRRATRRLPPNGRGVARARHRPRRRGRVRAGPDDRGHSTGSSRDSCDGPDDPQRPRLPLVPARPPSGRLGAGSAAVEPKPHGVLPLRTGVTVRRRPAPASGFSRRSTPADCAGLDALGRRVHDARARDAIVALALRLSSRRRRGRAGRVGLSALLHFLCAASVGSAEFARAATSDAVRSRRRTPRRPATSSLAMAVRQMRPHRRAQMSERLARPTVSPASRTGAPTRRSSVIALARRSSRVGTLALFDVDKFRS